MTRNNGVEARTVDAVSGAGSRTREPSLRRGRIAQALRVFGDNVREDIGVLRRARAKYLDEQTTSSVPVEIARRIGLQMMVAVRAMHLLRDAGFPLGAQLGSRLIRHAYGAEIHWQSRWAPGVIIVHGNGLVVGAGASIATGCALLHNVTLGDAYDAASGRIGGPTLETDVHVGPGCALLGPITVGASSKLMAGVVLDHSVAARSLLRPAPVVVSSRDKER